MRRRLRDIGDARIELSEDLVAQDSAANAPRTVAAPPLHHAAIWIAIAVIGVLAGSFATWRMRPSSAAPAPTSRLALPLPQGEQLMRTQRPAIAVSPNGLYVAFNTTRKGHDSLYLRALADSEPRLIVQDGGQYPFFSPDSQWLGFFEGGTLKKVAVQGGSPTVMADAAGPRGASWGDDDSIVFAPESRVSLLRVSAKGGPTEAFTALDAAQGETSHRIPPTAAWRSCNRLLLGREHIR